MPTAFKTTAAKAAANRANAKRSTGPRTERGKAASSRNARRHGFTSSRFVVAEEERDEYLELVVSLMEETAPESAAEFEAFQAYVEAQWNLRQLRAHESEILGGKTNPFLDEGRAKALDRVVRYRRMLQQYATRARGEMRALRNRREEGSRTQTRGDTAEAELRLLLKVLRGERTS